jgi:hypothetical protein
MRSLGVHTNFFLICDPLSSGENNLFMTTGRTFFILLISTNGNLRIRIEERYPQTRYSEGYHSVLRKMP